jgi:hypothetical protein
MKNSPILNFLLLLAACNPGDVESGNIEQFTDGHEDDGYGDSSSGETGTGVSNPGECWFENAPADAVRWQCEGQAEATIFFTLDVEIPDGFEGAENLKRLIDYGRLDFATNFGPWNGEAYDDPGVDACCLPSISGRDEEGLDDGGADSGDEGDEMIPQAGLACAHDCADQACRAIPGTLRRLADQIPGGIPILGPSYREQLRDLADWAASHQQECWDTMVGDGVSEQGAFYYVSGEWQIPNSELWPALTDLMVDGSCKVNDWYLPEHGEPLACMGINDNNDEIPSGSGGPVGGFDTFAPTGGEMRLDGPVIFGIEASGSAPILGLGDECPRGECSRLDAVIEGDVLELRQLLMVAPSTMSWEQNDMQLTIDGLHAMVEHPMSIPLEADDAGRRFEIPAGKLEVLFAGEVHGVPVKVVVPNVTPVTGTVFPLFDGSHGIAVDPFMVEHHDAFGTWIMNVELGQFVALEHAPRATFEVQQDGSTQQVDASASFDLDGDALTYEWYRDGVQVGEGPVVESEPTPDGATLMLRVVDEMGRSTWSNGLSTEGL